MNKTFLLIGLFFVLNSGIARDLNTEITLSGGFTFRLIAFGLLLVLTLYLLFLIRKGRAVSRRMAVLEKELGFLFDRAPCGYHSLDDQGRIIDMNQTLLHWLGYARQDVVGKLTFSDIVASEDNTDNEKIAALVKGDISGNAHFNFVGKSGEKLPVILRELTGDETQGRGKRLFSVLNNKECHDALERIKNLDQELESFSYSISHDLRAPLRSIDGYSKILQEDYGGKLGEEGQRVMNVIMNNAQRMGNLIDDLLEFGRLGRKPIQKSHLNMTDMVKGVVADLLSNAGGRRVNVTVSELDNVKADADMMRLVWLNLLENALKFTGKKDEAVIDVRSFRRDDEICYEVKDNGVGFDMKYAPKLFGVFQRLHKIQDFAGTGVGLAMVKRIVTRHRGRVWAEASLKSGATFYFTIPINDENE